MFRFRPFRPFLIIHFDRWTFLWQVVTIELNLSNWLQSVWYTYTSAPSLNSSEWKSGSVIEERKKKPVSEQKVNETNKVAFFGHQDVTGRKNETECAIEEPIEAQAISKARTAGQDPRQKATLKNQGGISKQSVTSFTKKIRGKKKVL